MMQNGRINSPKLRPRLSQAEADFEKYVHMFRDRGVDKIKYGHEGIMIILITTTNFNIKKLSQNFYHRLLMNK